MTKTEDQLFQEWRDTFPATHWSNKDLGACRLGWDAGRAALSQITDVIRQLTRYSVKPGSEVSARMVADPNGKWVSFDEAMTLSTPPVGAETGEPVALTVVDPDAWEPCSPSYLERGGSCDAPRVWNAVEQNHWHPRIAPPRSDKANVEEDDAQT